MTVMDAEPVVVVDLEPAERFVETPFVKALVNRAESYLDAGFPVHLRGPAGTGKTTLALHLARRTGRPVVFLHGDSEYTTSHLIGGEHGYALRKVADNFIRSVRKYEEDLVHHWVDDRLTVACRKGYTVLYDEFNRSRPEANNVLLSILQERLLSIPSGRNGAYVAVHPEFRTVFTSNPEEYAGVHPTQDALRERMITLDLGNFDRETEVAITCSHAPDLVPVLAGAIVDLVAAVRQCEDFPAAPTVRSSIKIARVLQQMQLSSLDSERAEDVLVDVLASGTSRTGQVRELTAMRTRLQQILEAR